jgi:hypothetical protein
MGPRLSILIAIARMMVSGRSATSRSEAPTRFSVSVARRLSAVVTNDLPSEGARQVAILREGARDPTQTPAIPQQAQVRRNPPV